MNTNIDLQKIAHELDFDIEDVEMLVDVFKETAQESLVKMKEAIKNNNFEDIFTSAHSIKGGAANITLNEISSLAEDIELNARAKNSIDYLEKYNKLENMLSNLNIG